MERGIILPNPGSLATPDAMLAIAERRVGRLGVYSRHLSIHRPKGLPMPQISLEYTASLRSARALTQVLADVHRILSEQGGVALDACKSRIRQIDEFVVGGGEEAAGFVHLAVEIFPKNDAWKAKIGPAILDLLIAAFPARGEAPITVHIADNIQPLAYFKDPPMKTPANTNHSPRERVAQAFAIKASTGSNQAIMDLCATDIQWTIHGSGALCRTYTSKADFVDNCLSVLGQRIDGSITAQVDQIIDQGDTVVVLWKGSGRTTWGEPYNNDYCWIFHFEGNLVPRADAYIDTHLLDRVMSHPL
jgi:ketosteroid isomerase-like protein/5-carboxymethyl-2-hydroxymuconate isomerase